MRCPPWLAVVGVFSGVCVGLAQDVRPGPAAGEEILRLDGLADPGRWAPSECSVTAAVELQAGGGPTLQMHIPVDYHGGEAKYPVGWPRMYCDLRVGPERSWSEYDRFEFDIFAKMTRPDVPKTPLTLQIHCPARPQGLDRPLSEIRLGEWVTVSVPVAAIQQVDQVARLGLNISESHYRDQDVLDFYIGGFRLVRSLECQVDQLTVQSPAIFADRGVLPVALVISGPPPKVSRGVPFTLRSGERVLRTETLPVRRGSQVLDMDVAELHLAAGEYTLTAFGDDPARHRSAVFRVVSSPWEEP